MLMPPVLVSASMKLVWVSIALPAVPMPVAALSTTALAKMSAGVSAPPSLIDPFETRVKKPSVRRCLTTIESGD